MRPREPGGTESSAGSRREHRQHRERVDDKATAVAGVVVAFVGSWPRLGTDGKDRGGNSAPHMGITGFGLDATFCSLDVVVDIESDWSNSGTGLLTNQPNSPRNGSQPSISAERSVWLRCRR